MKRRLFFLITILLSAIPADGYWSRREAGLFDAAFDGGTRARWLLTEITTPQGNVFALSFAHKFAASGSIVRSEIYVPQLETYFLAISPTEFLWRAPGLRVRPVRRQPGQKAWTHAGRIFSELGENRYQVEDPDGLIYHYQDGELTRMTAAGEELNVKTHFGRIEEIVATATGLPLLRVTYDELHCVPTSLETPQGIFSLNGKNGGIVNASLDGKPLIEFIFAQDILTQVTDGPAIQKFVWQKNSYLGNPRSGIDSPLLLQSDSHATYRWFTKGDFLRIEGTSTDGRAHVFEYLGRSGQVVRSVEE